MPLRTFVPLQLPCNIVATALEGTSVDTLTEKSGLGVAQYVDKYSHPPDKEWAPYGGGSVAVTEAWLE